MSSASSAFLSRRRRNARTAAWWRFGQTGEAGTLVIVTIFAALFFAASMAARLVGAYYARQ